MRWIKCIVVGMKPVWGYFREVLTAESHFFRRIMEEVFGNEQQFI